MKATESKTATPNSALQLRQGNPPFFSKGSNRKRENSAFFSEAQPGIQPFFTTSPAIQPKLTIGQPGDNYEQEADVMADKVVNQLTVGSSQPNPPTVQASCADCGEEEQVQKMEETEGMLDKEEGIQQKEIFESKDAQDMPAIQQKSQVGSPDAASPDLQNRLNTTKGSGQSLPKTTQASMGNAFGTDFSNVRVHTGNDAVQMSQEIGAQAFTHGSDIYFNRGKYDTGSSGGQRLLAHELTHTVQQGGETIRKFGAMEHYRIGHQGSKDEEGNERRVQLTSDYSLAYGEMVAMAGDHFISIAQMREFAQREEGINSRQELDYVRIVKIRGHNHRAAEFSDEIKENSERRYIDLATQNRSHFPNAEAGDESLSVTEKANKWMGDLEDFPNANAAYRWNHIMAILEAYQAGFQNTDISFALATEAFADHFLTDSFASGHILTPRSSITSYWNSLVPLFFLNLKGYIAEKIAEKLEKTMYWGIVTEEAVYSGALGQEGALTTVSRMLDEKGVITFGDVVSGAIHDYYNQIGIFARVGDRRVRLFGDGHLDEGEERDLAVEAVRLGYQDITTAYQMGISNQNMLDLFSLAEDGMFAAEKLLPQVIDENDLPEEERPIKWDYEDYTSLLADTKVQQAMGIFAREKASELESAASDLGDAEKEQAFREAVIEPLIANPTEIIQAVIEWSPDTGGGVFGHNEDDNALEYVEQIEESGNLAGLNKPQRIRLVQQLLGGMWVAGDEEESIVKIFETAPPSHRPEIYQAIEGHEWNGNFIEGFWVLDDDLWNAIDDDNRLRRLKNTINEGQPVP